MMPTHLVIKAMRDNGYKNAAYAVAELMDNAIQAGATEVELLCAERHEEVNQKSRARLYKIAVLDNGSGMDAKTLRMALQFGNGTRLDPENHDGIGRFGMGLPNSSISQARRVDVWSWQDGVENAIYTYLDLDEFENKQISEVPEVVSRQIPEVWKNMGNSLSNSGTLVVWSEIDRCMWRTAKAVIDNSELLIGRIYRYFLNDKDVKIRLASFNIKSPKDIEERFAVPNDPLYLMENTSCKEPFHDKPMFEKYGEESEYTVKFREKEYPIKIKFSLASQEARAGTNAGNLPHGKHSAKNIGVSIVRAGRELDLDPTWTNPSDPRERWWGVEIDFPPALDDLFGVTNNKQSARYFSYLATVDLDSMADEDENLNEIMDEMSADEDMRLPILKIAQHIKNQIQNLRNFVGQQKKGQQTQKRYEENSAGTQIEKLATDVIRERQEKNLKGESDSQETATEDERKEEIKEVLIDDGFSEDSADQLAATLIARKLKVVFDHANIGSFSFFDVKSKGGVMFITLNTSHPAYIYLEEILEEKIPYEDEEDACDEKVRELRDKFIYAREGLKLLLIAWARHEDETPDGNTKEKIREARWEWGKMAKAFFDS